MVASSNDASAGSPRRAIASATSDALSAATASSSSSGGNGGSGRPSTTTTSSSSSSSLTFVFGIASDDVDGGGAAGRAGSRVDGVGARWWMRRRALSTAFSTRTFSSAVPSLGSPRLLSSSATAAGAIAPASWSLSTDGASSSSSSLLATTAVDCVAAIGGGGAGGGGAADGGGSATRRVAAHESPSASPHTQGTHWAPFRHVEMAAPAHRSPSTT